MPLSSSGSTDSDFDIPSTTTADMAAGGILLPVDYVSQVPTANLCWAACAEMALRANGITNMRICNIVQPFAGSALDCCSDITKCDQPYASPEETFARIQLPGNAPDQYLFPFTWEGLVNEIQTGRRPVEVYFRWDGGDSAHVALAVGVRASDQSVYMNDPYYGSGWVSYGDVLDAYGNGGYWAETWQGIGASLGQFA